MIGGQPTQASYWTSRLLDSSLFTIKVCFDVSSCPVINGFNSRPLSHGPGASPNTDQDKADTQTLKCFNNYGIMSFYSNNYDWNVRLNIITIWPPRTEILNMTIQQKRNMYFLKVFSVEFKHWNFKQVSKSSAKIT